MGDWALRLAVGILATWRLACWLWRESGAQPIRALVCRWPWGAGQISCLWCVSFWVALPVTALAVWFWVPLVPLALSGGAMLLSGAGRTIWREMVDDG